MHRLNFQLNSRTRFLNHIKRAKSTRDLLRQIVEKRQEQQQALVEKQGGSSVRRSTSSASICRPFVQKLTNSPPEGAPIDYMGYVISTICPAPWAWVACFARADGRPFFVDEISQVFAETGPHPAKVLALSDAMLFIDRLVEADAESRMQPEMLT